MAPQGQGNDNWGSEIGRSSEDFGELGDPPINQLSRLLPPDCHGTTSKCVLGTPAQCQKIVRLPFNLNFFAARTPSEFADKLAFTSCILHGGILAHVTVVVPPLQQINIFIPHYFSFSFLFIDLIGLFVEHVDGSFSVSPFLLHLSSIIHLSLPARPAEAIPSRFCCVLNNVVPAVALWVEILKQKSRLRDRNGVPNPLTKEVDRPWSSCVRLNQGYIQRALFSANLSRWPPFGNRKKKSPET